MDSLLGETAECALAAADLGLASDRSQCSNDRLAFEGVDWSVFAGRNTGLQVLFEMRCQFGRDFAIDDHQHDLFVLLHRTAVDVD